MKIVDIVILILIFVLIVLQFVCIAKFNTKEKYTDTYRVVKLSANGVEFPVNSENCNHIIQFRHTPNEIVENSTENVGEFLKKCNKNCTCNNNETCFKQNDPASVAGSVYDKNSCNSVRNSV